jgi:hypothetical protein
MTTATTIAMATSTGRRSAATRAPAAELTAACLPVPALDAATRADMRALLARHFDGVQGDDFEADLAGKDRAVLLRDGAGRLRGFSTIAVHRSAATGARVLFSGDTIVDPDAWRSAVALRGWLATALAIADEAPGEPLWWFLLSSGHRTYRILTTLFRAFHPSPAGEDPALRARLDALARERFGPAWDPAAGVVRLPRSVHRLRPGVGDVTAARLRDPAVALFAARNPGHAGGDELACVAALTRANLTAAGRRLLGNDRSPFDGPGASGPVDAPRERTGSPPVVEGCARTGIVQRCARTGSPLLVRLSNHERTEP